MADRQRRPPKLDFARIEKATGISFSSKSKSDLELSLAYLRLTKKRPISSTGALRNLWQALEKDCNRCADTLRKFYSQRRRDNALALSRRSEERVLGSDDLPLVWEVRNHARKRGSLWPGKLENPEMLLLKLPDLIHELECLADLGHVLFQKRANRNTGRRPDNDLRWLVQKMFSEYQRSGHKSTLNRKRSTGNYEGPFLDLMKEILDQIGIEYQSSDALAQTIKKVIRPRKPTAPSQNGATRS